MVYDNDLTARTVEMLNAARAEFRYVASVAQDEAIATSNTEHAETCEELIEMWSYGSEATAATEHTSDTLDRRYVVCLNHIERAIAVAKTTRRGDSYERKYKPDKGEAELHTAYSFISARRPL